MEEVIYMQRIMIIGSSGSGKTVLSQLLNKRFNLPLYHLDLFFWRPNWVPTPDEEWKAFIKNLVKEDKWILDGNFTSTLDLRIQHADTIIFIDLPRVLRLYRVVKRRLMKNRERPDINKHCKEQLDWKLLKSVWLFGKKRKPEIMKKLEQSKNNKIIYIIESNSDLKKFVQKITQTQLTNEKL
jgi:adenylate kinase family enzyme